MKGFELKRLKPYLLHLIPGYSLWLVMERLLLPAYVALFWDRLRLVLQPVREDSD
jgi:hypothetical protein